MLQPLDTLKSGGVHRKQAIEHIVDKLIWFASLSCCFDIKDITELMRGRAVA
jgi:hypothetical protein